MSPSQSIADQLNQDKWQREQSKLLQRIAVACEDMAEGFEDIVRFVQPRIHRDIKGEWTRPSKRGEAMNEGDEMPKGKW